MRRTWSKRKIIAKIQLLDQRNSAYAQKEHNPLWKASVRYFGSWRDACEAAGFDYDAIRRYGPVEPPNKGSGGQCTVPGCPGEHHAKGYCKSCYSKKRRAGEL